MKRNLSLLLRLCLPAAATACSLFAQDTLISRETVRPHVDLPDDVKAAAAAMPMWTGTFTYNGKTYTYKMIGSDPSKGSATTTVPVFIVPLKLTFSDGTVFDASGPMDGLNVSAVHQVEASPIFNSVTWMAGSVTVGTTQYIDAFQRGNFWSSVSTVSPDYHVLMAIPQVLPEQSYTLTAKEGSTSPGPVAPYKRGTISNGFLDKVITPQVFAKFPQITPGTLTIFLTYNVFPGGNYGFHAVWTGTPGKGNIYTYVSYLEPYTQLIDADISTLAHEVGEVVDDPLTNNSTPCGSLEVGDPLSTAVFTVNANGQNWHPQDLAFIGYFTAPPATSVNSWFSFRDNLKKACK